MTASPGEALGADLGAIYDAARRLLPQVADEMHIAAVNTTTFVQLNTGRGAGLGSDPGPRMAALLSELHQVVSDTEDALRDVAQALVWTADELKDTDVEAKAKFESVKKNVDASLVPATVGA